MMSNLVGDLADFERTKFLLDESIRIGRKRLHDEFVQQNRGLLRFLDALFILLVLTNHAALFATNYLLIKEMPKDKISFYEANPMMEKYHEESLKIMSEVNVPERKNVSWLKKYGQYFNGFVKEGVLWSFVIIGYLYSRRTINTPEQLNILMSMILVALFLLSLDLFNNVGYLIGKIVA